MKKWMAIWLLVLLPMQLSWAVVAGYCQHETGATAKHPGHHTHDHQAADHPESGNDGLASPGVHHDCATCHLACAAALTSDLRTPAVVTDQERPFDDQLNPSWAHTERPERPQWPRLA